MSSLQWLATPLLDVIMLEVKHARVNSEGGSSCPGADTSRLAGRAAWQCHESRLAGNR